MIFRDFRLILTPKRGILHSKFKAITIDGDGQEKPLFVGKFHLVIKWWFSGFDMMQGVQAIWRLIYFLSSRFSV